MDNEISSLHSNIKKQSKYVLLVVRWSVYAVLIGIICGLVGVGFDRFLEFVAHIFSKYPILVLLSPLAGTVIVLLYRICKIERDNGTEMISESICEHKDVPYLIAPLVFLGTGITHLVGGSSGREGAAIQIGGSVGTFFGRMFKLKERETSIIALCGMSAVFSGVFGTPISAAVLSVEIISMGNIYYVALFPCVISALIGYKLALLCGITPAISTFPAITVPAFSVETVFKVLFAGVCFSAVTIVFVVAMKKSKQLFSKIENPYLRVVIGAAILILLTGGVYFATGTFDYNGAGMPVVISALEGNARVEAFALNIVFTSVTLGCGFKGGKIVPAFFIGSTFGCIFGSLIGLDPGFCAALGLIALFSGMDNCPLAAMVMAVEIFGANFSGEGFIYFSLVCALAYMLTGYFSLFSGREHVYSSLQIEYVDEDLAPTREFHPLKIFKKRKKDDNEN